MEKEEKFDWDDRPIDTNKILLSMSDEKAKEIYERIFKKPLDIKLLEKARAEARAAM